MAAALGTWSALKATKPRRIEGHTSNVEVPILYSQYIKGTVGETTEAGDTYILPHKFTHIYHINCTALTAVAAVNFLYGNGTTVGAFFADSATVAGPTQITTAATAGASTVVLTSATDIADAYNGCWLDIRYASGNIQTVKILDFAATTLVATLAEPLAESIATTGTYYVVRGTLITTASAAVTPTLSFEVIGTFE
jgi:hypothetical protein